jgi:hypothetical protein
VCAVAVTAFTADLPPISSISAEVRLAIANDHVKLLEESFAEQVAAWQNLSDQVVGMLQDLQWKCVEQEQSRTHMSLLLLPPIFDQLK